MTCLYLSLFFGMADNYATRDICFHALKEMPAARRTIVVWGNVPNLELMMRRKALERYWQDNWVPKCPECRVGWHQGYNFPDGLIPQHPSTSKRNPTLTTRPGGIYGPIIILGSPLCVGEGLEPVYERRLDK